MLPPTESCEAKTNNQQQNRPRGGAIETYQGRVMYTGENNATRTDLKATHLAACTSTVVYSSFAPVFPELDDSDSVKKTGRWNPFKRVSKRSASYASSTPPASLDNTRGATKTSNNQLKDLQSAQTTGHNQKKNMQSK